MERNRTRLLPCLVVLVLASAGCSLFAGAASMRIEVEVYRGPLSKEPELQWVEMMGMVRESINLMNDNQELMVTIARNNTLIEERATDLDGCKLGGFTRFSYVLSYVVPDIIDTSHCLMLRNLHDDAGVLKRELENIEQNGKHLDPTLVKNKKGVIAILLNVAKTSSEASAKSFSWSISSIAGTAINRLIRIAMVNFIVSSSEIGRQLNLNPA